MKKIAFCLGLFIFSAMSYSVFAQNVVDAEENENNFDGFYEKHLTSEKKAIPFAPVRESDVVWQTCIWRTIDMREKFNQFFYFPIQREEDGNTQKRKNLFYTIWEALETGQIEAYDSEDDEFKRPPIDFETLKDSEKGCILHSRILWFYSNTYLTIGGEDNLANATHTYEFIKK